MLWLEAIQSAAQVEQNFHYVLAENHRADILYKSDVRILCNQYVLWANPRRVAGKLLKM
jgi:hypothetical protein